ncbi:bifunctional 2-polyprenyl-6-hydroxyphenol methylase/3-demethylubiquinol 3-O-methyltransferase UbiG [Ancylobacter sp. TS-1]|uniref:class I SAM-dependent methyltransferase n=1 Tax=Ancylobacter sp. TS-1 TaxID=1850374 RepID=UPI001265BFF5|nr:methyltransferase domain-containing protein [Ancylobacter sp. TS-1]QFR34684.1 methyltransferase domain-containing protein [Ancylobacter sp. TS-1]
MDHLAQRTRNGMAFGVDPTRTQFYSLRQARYDALATSINEMSAQFAAQGKRLKLMDIGVHNGTMLRHLEHRSARQNIDYSIADMEIGPVYGLKSVDEIFIGDLTRGYPDIPSNGYDVVICEQVLEHITTLETPIRTLERITRPGGYLFAGVPAFPHGIHKVREVAQPTWDRYFPPGKIRGHVQSFSTQKFLRLFKELTKLEPVGVRGFRFISGGPLRALEEYQWWWRLSQTVGRTMPSICTEIQVQFRKPMTAANDCQLAASHSSPFGSNGVAEHRATAPVGE